MTTTSNYFEDRI